MGVQTPTIGLMTIPYMEKMGVDGPHRTHIEPAQILILLSGLLISWCLTITIPIADPWGWYTYLHEWLIIYGKT